MFKFVLELKDYIKGGLSDNMTLQDISKKHDIELTILKKEHKKGIKVEREHTSDINIAKEIAKDHLVEDPFYYTKLIKMEKNEK